MNLFTLLGTIAINNSDANRSIDESSEKASSFGDKLKNGIGTAAKWGTAIVGGAAAATTGMVEFAKSAASTADNVDKMSQKIGISRDAYQELDFICSQSGTSVDNLQAGMKTLVSAMDGAASGTAANAEQFEKLGVSVTDANGNLRSSEDVLFETMSALQKMGNQTEKARLATELFGRSGTELMPLLNGAAGSIDEMKQQAHDLGLVLDDELIDNGVNMTDAMDQMQRAISALGTQLGGALMPIVEDLCDFIIANLPTIQGIISSIAPTVTGLLSSLLPPLMELVQTLLPPLVDLINQILPFLTDIVSAILPVIVNLLKILLPPLIQLIQMVLPLLKSLLEPLLPLLQPLFDLLQPFIDLLILILEPLTELLNIILPPLIQVISELISMFIDSVMPVFQSVAKSISGVLNVAFESIRPIIEGLAKFIPETWNKIKDSVKKIFDTISKTTSEIWNGISTSISGIITGIATSMSTAWNEIKEFTSGAFNSIKETIVGIWDDIWDGIKGVINKILGGIEKWINGIISALNALIESINKIIGSIGGLIGVNVAIGKISDVALPRLAKGGVLDEGQVGLLEGDGAEAVVPLDQNRKWISAVAADMGSAMGGNSADEIKELKEIVKDFVEALPDMMIDAYATMKFDVNNREFARLVKAVN